MPVLALNTQPCGGVALRIEIDNQDAPAHSRQRRAEIYGRRCLPDPALLVHDCKDSRFTADHA